MSKLSDFPGLDRSQGPLKPAPKRVVKPGPGAYNPDPGDGSFERCVSSTHQRMTLSKSRTNWQEDVAISRTRGGPLYDPNAAAVQKREPSWGFSKHEAKGAKQTGPGPQLEHGDNLNFGKAPSFGFGSERRVLKIPTAGNPKAETVPGPGHVEPKRNLTEQAQATFSMGSPRRSAPAVPSSARRREMPGPGSYDTVTDFGHESPRMANPGQATPRCRLGTAARSVMDPVKKRMAPAPGGYDIHEKSVGATGSGGPKWSMTGRAEFDLAASTTYV